MPFFDSSVSDPNFKTQILRPKLLTQSWPWYWSRMPNSQMWLVGEKNVYFQSVSCLVAHSHQNWYVAGSHWWNSKCLTGYGIRPSTAEILSQNLTCWRVSFEGSQSMRYHKPCSEGAYISLRKAYVRRESLDKISQPLSSKQNKQLLWESSSVQYTVHNKGWNCKMFQNKHNWTPWVEERCKM